MSTGVVTPRLDEEVAALGGLSRDQLTAMWQRAHGCPPPSGVRNELLVRSAAWYCQAKQTAGFSADTRRRLKLAMRKVQAELDGRLQAKAAAAAIISLAGAQTNSGEEPRHAAEASLQVDHGGSRRRAATASKAASPLPPPRQEVLPGARLLRDWNGRTHVVDVVEGGFLYDGRQHRSLSAVAKLITGAHWSGPRFFGLLP